MGRGMRVRAALVVLLGGSMMAVGGPASAAGAATSAIVPAANSWSGLGSNGSGNGPLGPNFAEAVLVVGSKVYVGGNFQNAGDVATADDIAVWNGSTWAGLGSNGSGNGALGSYVDSIAISGTDLYVGGGFTNAGGDATADYVAKFDTLTDVWSGLGNNGGGGGALGADVSSLAIVGSTVYVGGSFANAAGIAAADYVAAWNGSSWSSLGESSIFDGTVSGPVSAVAAMGTDVHVGGDIGVYDGVASASYIAMWDGANWSPLGPDTSRTPALNGAVRAIAVSGSDVYAGGDFTNAAGAPEADHVAEWDGVTWSPLGSSAAITGATPVSSLAASGGVVVVGGSFTDVALMGDADYVAEFDGTNWSALGSNGSGDGAIGDIVDTVAISGTSIYAGGAFANAGGDATADSIARFGPSALATYKPDGRIRVGTSGAFIGNDVYNANGASQSKTGSAKKNKTVTFGISVQNDSTAADAFTVKATGAAASAYTVKYFYGATDITAAVVAGTYSTGSIAAGATKLITATVKVKSSAAAGSKVTRLVTITSAGDGAKKDAVKFIGKRA